jgi:hypothetical protein
MIFPYFVTLRVHSPFYPSMSLVLKVLSENY